MARTKKAAAVVTLEQEASLLDQAIANTQLPTKEPKKPKKRKKRRIKVPDGYELLGGKQQYIIRANPDYVKFGSGKPLVVCRRDGYSDNESNCLSVLDVLVIGQCSFRSKTESQYQGCGVSGSIGSVRMITPANARVAVKR